ncbi:MAG: Holliday junction branch migration protein RuvA [Planctomycetota bacterium]|jgi:Holliday junction DNA helicase RuvA
MISRIEGELVSVQDGRAELQCGALTYALLVPAADEPRLAGLVGDHVGFHALHYLESQGQGTSFAPRLIGFASAEERAFFELLTTVKGMGTRRALKALQLPYRAIAEAIVNKDVDLLTTLPEIGRRTAETIVAELHGRVDGLIELKPDGGRPATAPQPAVVGDALAALVQLGEPKPRARRLIEQALAADPTLDSADALVGAAYRLREG